MRQAVRAIGTQDRVTARGSSATSRIGGIADSKSGLANNLLVLARLISMVMARERAFSYHRSNTTKKEAAMTVYKVIEIVGTSPDSWEAAAEAAIERAGETLRDLRIAEVVKQDVQIEEGKIVGYRVRLNISFRFQDE